MNETGPCPISPDRVITACLWPPFTYRPTLLNEYFLGILPPASKISDSKLFKNVSVIHTFYHSMNQISSIQTIIDRIVSFVGLHDTQSMEGLHCKPCRPAVEYITQPKERMSVIMMLEMCNLAHLMAEMMGNTIVFNLWKFLPHLQPRMTFFFSTKQFD